MPTAAGPQYTYPIKPLIVTFCEVLEPQDWPPCVLNPGPITWWNPCSLHSYLVVKMIWYVGWLEIIYGSGSGQYLQIRLNFQVVLITASLDIQFSNFITTGLWPYIPRTFPITLPPTFWQARSLPCLEQLLPVTSPLTEEIGAFVEAGGGRSADKWGLIGTKYV